MSNSAYQPVPRAPQLAESTHITAPAASSSLSLEAAPEPEPEPKTKPKLPYSAYSDGRKRFILIIVTSAAFLAPLSGNIYLPALPLLTKEFNVGDVAINATVSVFMLVFAIAPLFWGACSDYIGRKPLYTISFLIFVFANVVLAAVPSNYAALLILRILQAIGASSVASLGAGTVADIYAPSVRASAISVFMLGPQIGPVLGPLIGGGIISTTTWRWIFGFLAILGFVVWVWMLFCLPETLRARVGNSAVNANRPWATIPRFKQRVEIEEGTIIMKRPSAVNVFKILKYPPMIIASTNVALLFGGYYCVAVTLPRVMQDTYKFSYGATGAAYMVPGVAMVAGSLLSGRLADKARARAIKASPDGIVPPEFRLRSQIYGVIGFPIGLEMYGWFSHYELHPSSVLFSTFIIGFCMSWVFATNTTYMTECRPGAAATLVALAGLFRNPAAAIASVIIDPVVESVGMGWAFRALAAVNLVCVGLVMLLILYGPDWRKKMVREQPMGGNCPLKRAAAAKAAAEAGLAPAPSGCPHKNNSSNNNHNSTPESKSEIDNRITQLEDTIKGMVNKDDIKSIVDQRIEAELRAHPSSWRLSDSDITSRRNSPITLSDVPLIGLPRSPREF